MNVPDGPRLFARYALPPNLLGYCGPEESAEYAAVAFAPSTPLADLHHFAASFSGAWPYLQLIAGCAGITDALDRRVVEAYWVGNALLDMVDRSAFLEQVDGRFRSRSWRDHDLVASAAVVGHPNHSFHVFCAYPWVGLLRAGKVEPSLRVLDRCRIRWGTVEAVDSAHVTVGSRPLLWDERRLTLGPERVEYAGHGGDSAVSEALTPGDVVALHWDYVCDVLTPQRLERLVRENDHHLRIVNGAAGRLADRLVS